MTKRELIEAVINERSSIPRREAEALVNSVFASLAEALARGERIEIRGFGSFIVKRRNAREGLNPKTGEVVSVMAKRVPFFKAGKELKQRVDRQSDGYADPSPTPVAATAQNEG
jgi:integration host factor beta subunit